MRLPAAQRETAGGSAPDDGGQREGNRRARGRHRRRRGRAALHRPDAEPARLDRGGVLLRGSGPRVARAAGCRVHRHGREDAGHGRGAAARRDASPARLAAGGDAHRPRRRGHGGALPESRGLRLRGEAVRRRGAAGLRGQGRGAVPPGAGGPGAAPPAHAVRPGGGRPLRHGRAGAAPCRTCTPRWRRRPLGGAGAPRPGKPGWARSWWPARSTARARGPPVRSCR